MTMNKLKNGAVFMVRSRSGEVVEWDGTTRLYATHKVGSDIYPYEVLEVLSPNRLTVRELETTNAEGYDYYSNQVYDYHSDERYEVIPISKRKNGRWARVGTKGYTYYSILMAPMKYQDPYF